MTESPETPWPLVHGYLFSLPHSSRPLVPRRRRHSVTRLCDPTPSCSLPHPLAHHCPPASLVLPGCCNAVGMGALDPAVRGFGCVPARTGPLQHGPADAADVASPVLVAVGAAMAPHASVQAFLGRLRWERSSCLESAKSELDGRGNSGGGRHGGRCPLDFALLQVSSAVRRHRPRGASSSSSSPK